MDAHFKCTICKRTFTQKSSLIRHNKRCTPGPAPSLRQKSCRQCTNSKTKCDLQRPKCTRCEQRDTACDYVVPMTRGTRLSSSSMDDVICANGNSQESGSGNLNSTVGMVPISLTEAPQALYSGELEYNMDPSFASYGFINPSITTTDQAINLLATDKDPFANYQWSTNITPNALTGPVTQYDMDTSNTSSETSPDSGDFDFDGWLLWNPGPAKSTPLLVQHSMETLLKVIKTWPKMLAKGFQVPPMLHFSHTHHDTMLQPMANCVTISKMWAGQSDGASEIVRQTIIQEMRSLFQRYRSMDERHLLSAMQALTLYTVILMFPGAGQNAVSLVDPAIFLSLRKVVSYVAKTGMMLVEERDNERPSWESWVHITGKRRAVFTLYLLHWAYSVYHSLPSFECSQLGFMPAPAPKFLWQADSKEKWEDLYTRWLAQWGDCPYMMREFAAIQAGATLERRSEIWLEDADELGILFFSIVNATDREPEFDYGTGINVLTIED